jgi:hypothetical protein
VSRRRCWRSESKTREWLMLGLGIGAEASLVGDFVIATQPVFYGSCTCALVSTVSLNICKYFAFSRLDNSRGTRWPPLGSTNLLADRYKLSGSGARSS